MAPQFIFLVSTDASIPPEELDRDVAIVTRNDYETLGRGGLVNSYTVKRDFTEVRKGQCKREKMACSIGQYRPVDVCVTHDGVRAHQSPIPSHCQPL